jgi:hypothetical protein
MAAADILRLPTLRFPLTLVRAETASLRWLRRAVKRVRSFWSWLRTTVIFVMAGNCNPDAHRRPAGPMSSGLRRSRRKRQGDGEVPRQN